MQEKRKASGSTKNNKGEVNSTKSNQNLEKPAKSKKDLMEASPTNNDVQTDASAKKLSKNQRRKASKQNTTSGESTAKSQAVNNVARRDSVGEQKHQEKEAQEDHSRKGNKAPNQGPRPVPTKNPFIPRASHLDHSQKDSTLNASEFRGFFNLFLMAGFFFVCSANVRQLLVQGTLVGLKSLRTLVPLDMIPWWLLLVATSHAIVLIQKLKLLKSPRIPNWFTWTLYGILQAALMGGTIWLLLAHRWAIIPTGVYLGEMIVICMKIHSFIMTNMEYQKEMEKEQKKRKKNKEPVQTEDSKDPAKFPNNVTFANYFYFLCAPTLVYELSYPRTEKIRPFYIIEKCITVVGVFSVLHVIVNKYITPILLQTSTISVPEAIIQLIMPYLFCYILVFYIIFDIICNGFAEVTRFSDRQFYTDWWNSTTWDEFARKWNKPVHEWLLRHIYLEGLKSFKGDRFSATLATFLTSSVAHELVLSVMFRTFQPWMFVLQMMQVPLIFLGKFLKGTRAGNFFFWFAMAVGPPLLTILYCREYMMMLSPTELKEIETQILDNNIPDLLI